MEILVRGLPSGYELEHLTRIFYTGAQVRAGHATRGPLAYARVNARGMAAGLRLADGRLWLRRAPAPPPGQSAKTSLSRLLYDVLCEATGQRPPWGMLTGVRPVRLLRNRLAAGGEAAARENLRGVYDVSGEKYALARGIVDVQAPVLAAQRPNSYSVYVSIPFCPSRCAYCSFVSRTIEREAGLVDEYLVKLAEELRLTAALAKELGLRLESVYIGGGTPTALSAAQLEAMLASVEGCFDTGSVEYTVEAGRPDCTDEEKLRILQQHGVTRISINPQSMQNGVLAAIGRRHTAEDIERCFAEARKAGHANINMDLIAGLPADDAAGFAQSLGRVLALGPESVTVHTLTRKRASNLVIDASPDGSDPAAMLAAAYPALAAAGYRPYYLYRQKNTAGNFENTGWARPGADCLYNIYIMEESHTILACGAGGVTKLVDLPGGRIQRLFGSKYPADYIADFDRIIEKKMGVRDFYASHLDTETPG